MDHTSQRTRWKQNRDSWIKEYSIHVVIGNFPFNLRLFVKNYLILELVSKKLLQT